MSKIISGIHIISSEGPFCAVCSIVLVFFWFTYHFKHRDKLTCTVTHLWFLICCQLAHLGCLTPLSLQLKQRYIFSLLGSVWPISNLWKSAITFLAQYFFFSFLFSTSVIWAKYFKTSAVQTRFVFQAQLCNPAFSQSHCLVPLYGKCNTSKWSQMICGMP